MRSVQPSQAKTGQAKPSWEILLSYPGAIDFDMMPPPSY